jgi:hypothetical protein
MISSGRSYLDKLVFLLVKALLLLEQEVVRAGFLSINLPFPVKILLVKEITATL